MNADDLGLHADIDTGIERAHTEGVVTSASICAVGDSFRSAVELCRRCPQLDVGVHLTLVEERPLTGPHGLGGLVGRDGLFPATHRGLVVRVASGRVSSSAVRRELGAQVERVLEAGLTPTHLDSHQHVHLMPAIWPEVLGLALEHGIGWVRVPGFEPVGEGEPAALTLALRVGLNALAGRRRSELAAEGRTLRHADATPSLGWSGHLTADRVLAGLDGAAGAAVVELVAHPGDTTDELGARYAWGYDWTGETDALCSAALRAGIAERGFALGGFPAVAA